MDASRQDMSTRGVEVARLNDEAAKKPRETVGNLWGKTDIFPPKNIRT